MTGDQEQKEYSPITLEDQVGSGRRGPSGKTTRPVVALEAKDRIEMERREAYIDPKTRSFLRKLLESGEKEEIIPIYQLGAGFVYPITCEGMNDNGAINTSRECLENLTKLGILNERFYDSAVACPNCQSTTITLHTRCPNCKSHNVEKTNLTEHIPCGYIDQKENYKNNQCPKCGEQLVDAQYRSMGRWYVCQECKERFENPESDLVCRKCIKKFTIKEAQVVELPKYSLNLERRNEIRQNVASLDDVRAILTNLGFRVELPGVVIGQKSGMQHQFSLIAKRQINDREIVVALDHAVSESEVQTSPLILFVYKTSEVRVDIPVFMAVPKLDDSAKKIAQGHNILLIEGFAEQKEAEDQIRAQIENRTNQIVQINKPISQQSQSKPETSSSFFSKIRGGRTKT
jgi:predicted RNA-binding Zn-ribbon protein involved in translation (DUF1610 family)